MRDEIASRHSSTCRRILFAIVRDHPHISWRGIHTNCEAYGVKRGVFLTAEDARAALSWLIHHGSVEVVLRHYGNGNPGAKSFVVSESAELAAISGRETSYVNELIAALDGIPADA